MLTVPKRTDIQPTQEQRRVETNTKLKDWARKHSNVTWLLDLANRFPSSTKFWDDDVHPNEHGYDVMGDMVYNTVVEMYTDLAKRNHSKGCDDGNDDCDSGNSEDEGSSDDKVTGSKSGSGSANESGEYDDDEYDDTYDGLTYK